MPEIESYGQQLLHGTLTMPYVTTWAELKSVLQRVMLTEEFAVRQDMLDSAAAVAEEHAPDVPPWLLQWQQTELDKQRALAAQISELV